MTRHLGVMAVVAVLRKSARLAPDSLSWPFRQADAVGSLAHVAPTIAAGRIGPGDAWDEADGWH